MPPKDDVTGSDDFQQSIKDEYLTLEGIHNKTGVSKNNLFQALTKEIIDNALDDVEKSYVPEPCILINTKGYEKDSIQMIKIAVRNPVSDNAKPIFSKDRLDSIYNFSNFYGSKRIHRTTRGIFGDASKFVLGAPYALASALSLNIPKEDRGITIRSSAKNSLQTFHVYLNVDKVNPDNTKSIVVPAEEMRSTENFTEIEVSAPKVHISGYTLIEDKIHSFLRNYMMLVNTHIGFTFDEHFYRATQPIIEKPNNLTSAHFYTASEFENLISTISNNKQSVYEFLKITFRETKNLPIHNQEELKQITIRQLKIQSTRSHQIHSLLKKVMEPISIRKGVKDFLSFSIDPRLDSKQ